MKLSLFKLLNVFLTVYSLLVKSTVLNVGCIKFLAFYMVNQRQSQNQVENLKRDALKYKYFWLSMFKTDYMGGKLSKKKERRMKQW